jgi:hypothetical protein
MSMVKKLTSLILLPLLLFLEVGIGPIHNFLGSEGSFAGSSVSVSSSQLHPVPDGACPVCRFLQISFLLSLIVISSIFRHQSLQRSVREIAFPAEPLRILPSRGPPAF